LQGREDGDPLWSPSSLVCIKFDKKQLFMLCSALDNVSDYC